MYLLSLHQRFCSKYFYRYTRDLVGAGKNVVFGMLSYHEVLIAFEKKTMIKCHVLPMPLFLYMSIIKMHNFHAQLI